MKENCRLILLPQLDRFRPQRSLNCLHEFVALSLGHRYHDLLADGQRGHARIRAKIGGDPAEGRREPVSDLKTSTALNKTPKSLTVDQIADHLWVLVKTVRRWN